MVKEELERKAALIDKHLDMYLPVRDNAQKTIYEAMRYSVFAGGKRLRPVLMISMCEMCGGSMEEALPFACAMEMIHTYSLIHDDLPAMDNDDLRRGKPTNHKKYGEAAAILAGDALLNRAFEVVSDYSGAYPDRAIKAISILSRSSGTEGMIGGQVVDMESEGRKISLGEIEYMHLLKTGAIIRSACVIGAMLGGGGKAEIDAADEFAKNLGIAFQITDDILDVEGSAEELGKSIGSDAKENKSTYVSLMGLEKSKIMARDYSERAKKALGIFGEKAAFLKELTDSLTERKN